MVIGRGSSSVAPWCCRNCGQMLGQITAHGGCRLRIAQGSEVTADGDGGTSVRCPICGAWRKFLPIDFR